MPNDVEDVKESSTPHPYPRHPSAQTQRPQHCPPFPHSHDAQGRVVFSLQDLPQDFRTHLLGLQGEDNLQDLEELPPEFQERLESFMAQMDTSAIGGEPDIGEAISNWIWQTPPVTRGVCFLSIIMWLVTAIPIGEEYKPSLCNVNIFGDESTASSSAWIAARLSLWWLNARSVIVATIATITLHREVSAMENRRGSIYAFAVLVAMWVFQLGVFLGLLFVIDNSDIPLCLHGMMGLTFGVKQLENSVYPREDKMFLCTNLYYPAILHMFPAAVLYQVLSFALWEGIDLSVFLGTFTGVLLSLNWIPCRGICRARYDGLEKKECFWLSQSSAYVPVKDNDPTPTLSRGLPPHQLRSRSSLGLRSPSRASATNEETTHLLVHEAT